MMTISTQYKLWKEEKRGRLKPASLSTYTVLVERYILPAVGEQETVTPEDVQRIVKGMAGKSAKTHQLTLDILRNILRFGGLPLPVGVLEENTGSGHKENTLIAEAVRILPDLEVRKLIAGFQQNPTPRNVGLYLALTTGIRASELCALRWQDVDDALHIRGSVSYLWDTEQHAWRAKEEGEQALVPRDIPLTKAQRQFLQQHRGAAATYILTGENTPMQPHSLRAGTLRFLKQMGLHEYSLADFRHGFVVRCLQSGCNYTTLGALLGVQSLQRLQKKYGRFALTTPTTAMEKQMAAL